MMLYTGKASGRTTCNKCHKQLEKGSKQLVAQGYQSSGRFHVKCVREILKKGV